MTPNINHQLGVQLGKKISWLKNKSDRKVSGAKLVSARRIGRALWRAACDLTGRLALVARLVLSRVRAAATSFCWCVSMCGRSRRELRASCMSRSTSSDACVGGQFRRRWAFGAPR